MISLAPFPLHPFGKQMFQATFKIRLLEGAARHMARRYQPASFLPAVRNLDDFPRLQPFDDTRENSADLSQLKSSCDA